MSEPYTEKQAIAALQRIAKRWPGAVAETAKEAAKRNIAAMEPSS